jgi:uncharacterized protein with HEPN domain
LRRIVRLKEDAFLASPVLQDATLMRLQVIGEHLARIRRIDEDRFADVADRTWFQVIGLRNIISHGYETIDQERIWQIVNTDLSSLAANLHTLTDG